MLRIQNRREAINAEPKARFWIQSSLDFMATYNDVVNQSEVFRTNFQMLIGI